MYTLMSLLVWASSISFSLVVFILQPLIESAIITVPGILLVILTWSWEAYTEK